LTTKCELSFRRLTRKLLPGLVEDVVHVRFARHRILAGIAGSATKQNDFGLADDRNGVAKTGLGDFAIDFKFFDNLIAVACNLCLVLWLGD